MAEGEPEMCAALISFVGEERQVSTASSKEEGHNIGVITYILKGLIFIILMLSFCTCDSKVCHRDGECDGVSCTCNCRDKYQTQISDCHKMYASETVNYKNNNSLLNCIGSAENNYQDHLNTH